MDSENYIPNTPTHGVDINDLFDEIVLTAPHPSEVFHMMLHRLTEALPETLSGRDVIREVSNLSRQITECLICNEFEITY